MNVHQRLADVRAMYARNLEGTEEVLQKDLRKGDVIVSKTDGSRFRVERVRRLMATGLDTFDLELTLTGSIRTFEYNGFQREPTYRLVRD